MKISGRIAILCTFLVCLTDVPRLAAEGSNPAGTIGYTGANVGEIIERVEPRIDEFGKQFKKSLDDTLDSDRLLLESTEALEKSFDKVNGKFESGDAIRPRLEQALAAAGSINHELVNRRVAVEAISEWSEIRRDLNKLADIYGMTPLEDR